MPQDFELKVMTKVFWQDWKHKNDEIFQQAFSNADLILSLTNDGFDPDLIVDSDFQSKKN